MIRGVDKGGVDIFLEISYPHMGMDNPQIPLKAEALTDL